MPCELPQIKQGGPERQRCTQPDCNLSLQQLLSKNLSRAFCDLSVQNDGRDCNLQALQRAGYPSKLVPYGHNCHCMPAVVSRECFSNAALTHMAACHT